jgi:Tfp pilus assembly protein PilO
MTKRNIDSINFNKFTRNTFDDKLETINANIKIIKKDLERLTIIMEYILNQNPQDTYMDCLDEDVKECSYIT